MIEIHVVIYEFAKIGQVQPKRYWTESAKL